MKKVKLQDGRKIYCIDRMTAKAVHHELYLTENTYISQGITLKDGDTVFDIGANTGQFTLYLCEHYKDLRIFTFEPIPDIFKVLCANLDGKNFANTADGNIRITNFNLGLAEKEASMVFYYYPRASVYSSMYQVDEKNQKQLVINNYSKFQKGIPLLKLLPESFKFIVANLSLMYYKKTKRTCRTTTISSIIKQNNIQKIDLLKIDAENSEAEVIAGIRETDWYKIKQISMEVHGCAVGRESPLEPLKSLLLKKGFTINTFADDIMNQANVAMLYAIRI